MTNYESAVQGLQNLLDALTRQGIAAEALFPSTEFRDMATGLSFAECATLLRRMDECTKAADLLKKELQKGFDFIRFTAMPAVMEKADIESGKVAGIGTISLISDLNVSIRADCKELAYRWLDDNGHGDLIQPTINSSTLRAFAKDRVRAGDPLPTELFNITYNTRAQVTRKA